MGVEIVPVTAFQSVDIVASHSRREMVNAARW